MGLRLFVSLLLASGLVQAAGLAGIYTEQQAAQGKLGYDQHCAQCHHLTLRGTATMQADLLL